MTLTTQPQVRAAFWADHPHYQRIPGKRQNGYKADIRLDWCDYVYYLQRNGTISEALADRATL